MKNSLLLEDELKRIGLMMNYKPGKLVTENLIDNDNLIIVEKVNNLFSPTTKTEIISETTLKKVFKEVWELKKEKSLLEQWVKGTDQTAYWKILFDQLKIAGIGVKWQVANDPVKSTFMYWGPWVIWKDINKNGGWPVTFTGTDKKLWLFRFPGGKYAGQPINNINLESKYIGMVFNLEKWGKVDQTKGTPALQNLLKTKPKTGGAQTCKTVDGKTITTNQIPAVATQIYKELSYAFDGVGTYEDEAVAAYKKITCKPILDAVNVKVAARGMQGIKNVGDWAKAEMSDYDYNQYRQIWTSLQKLGYKAPPVNQAMKLTGTVVKTAADLTGLSSLADIAKALGNLSFDDIFEGIRNFLTGTAGSVITTILDVTGIGKLATSTIWVIMSLWDSYKLSIGNGDWFKLFGSFVGIITTGAIAKSVGKLLKPFMGSGGTLTSMFQKLSTQSWFKNTFTPIIGGIGKMLGNISGVVSSTITWLEKNLGITFLKNIGNKVVTWLEDMATKLAKSLGVKQEIQKTVGSKIVSGVVTDPTKEKAKELAIKKAEETTSSKNIGSTVSAVQTGKGLIGTVKNLKPKTT